MEVLASLLYICIKELTEKHKIFKDTKYQSLRDAHRPLEAEPSFQLLSQVKTLDPKTLLTKRSETERQFCNSALEDHSGYTARVNKDETDTNLPFPRGGDAVSGIVSLPP